MISKKLMTATLIVTTVVLFAGQAQAVNIETVPVGNTGNLPDSTGYGAVAYGYNIGKYEVTAGQYTEFLNAVADTDDYLLWDARMDDYGDPSDPVWADLGPQIFRTGSQGSYEYSVAADWANRPVNYVSVSDGMRFANWLHNGQPTTGVQDASTTEDGTYPLLGQAGTGEKNPDNAELYQLALAGRNAGWTWALPSLDEWFKAAYHYNDGDTGNYWGFPTQSEDWPGYVADGDMVSQGCASGCKVDAAGDVIIADPGNYATYNRDTTTGKVAGIGPTYYLTEVGEWENSAGPYGTFDQAGNLDEITETITVFEATPWDGTGELARMGGNFRYHAYMNKGFITHSQPRNQNTLGGLRMVQIPEPGSLIVLVGAAVGVLLYSARKWRRNV